MKPLKHAKPYNPFPTDHLKARPLKSAVRRTAKLDAAIGKTLKSIRLANGISREKMAPMIGVSVEQLRKYEEGSNRLSAGRVAIIAAALNVHPMVFFADVPGIPEPPNGPIVIPATSAFEAMNIASLRDAKVVNAYCAISCEKQRGAILNLMRAMAQADSDE